jgi:hypothetical protein
MTTFYRFILIAFLLHISALTVKAQKENKRTDQPWQLDVAAGLHSFYAPVKDLKVARPELLTTAGLGKPLGPNQSFAVTLQLGYARNNYQGDALYMQLLGQYTPLIAKKVEAGLGLGFGYRFAFYSSPSQKWNGQSWVKGSPAKGMYQVPVQLSIGYRSLKLTDYQLRPYLAYQLQALFGYNPDLSPLPVSAGLLGLKIQKVK